MNPLILDLGQAQILHPCRSQQGTSKRSWSAAESIRLAMDQLKEEPPVRWASPLDELFEVADSAELDFIWWPLVSEGAGRHVFGGVCPAPDLPSEPPLPKFPWAPDLLPHLDIEDYFEVFHRGWPTRVMNDNPDARVRAIAILAKHAYFQTNHGIGFRTRAIHLLQLVVFLHEFWLRPVSDWTPPDGDAFTCVADLFAYLVFRYEVPQWLDPRGGPPDRDWDDPNWLTLAVFTGRGGSLHEGLAYLAMDRWGQPLLTRRGVQQFASAPRELSFKDALRYAFVLASGGDLAAFHDFQALGDQIQFPFAAPVVRALAPWLARNRNGIAPGMGSLIILWAHAGYLGTQQRRVEASSKAPPWNPTRTFTLGRRSLRSIITEILSQISDFRNPLCRRLVYNNWPARGWDRTLTIADVEWTARELCTIGDLAREGTEMRHCVLQYHTFCATGHTTVVSLVSNEGDRVTIQVCPVSLELLQIRGPANRDPFLAELIAAESWRQTAASVTPITPSLAALMA